MSGASIIFDGVSKKFRRGERHDSLRDLLPGVLGRMASRGKAADSEVFWALRDVSFEVKPGEALGIIGPNGAGKSTTLKLLTRILRPTSGRCEIRGRAGALIEVAAGFHPDLTGRENVYLQGAIMGMKGDEIKTRLDEIVDFAGVAEFIDTPVKRYSSGMNARLGFSIAAHLEPDVLVIDEVLSVGDMVFQQRCIDRMLTFRERGVAIVFVSHHLASVLTLCQSALLLNHEVIASGPAPEVVTKYVRLVGGGDMVSRKDDVIAISEARLVDQQGLDVADASPGAKLRVSVVATARADIGRDVVFGFLCHQSSDDQILHDTNFQGRDVGWNGLGKGESVRIEFGFRVNLLRGIYHLGLNVYDPSSASHVLKAPRVKMLNVVEQFSYAGVVALDAECRCDPVE